MEHRQLNSSQCVLFASHDFFSSQVCYSLVACLFSNKRCYIYYTIRSNFPINAINRCPNAYDQ